MIQDQAPVLIRSEHVQIWCYSKRKIKTVNIITNVRCCVIVYLPLHSVVASQNPLQDQQSLESSSRPSLEECEGAGGLMGCRFLLASPSESWRTSLTLFSLLNRTVKEIQVDFF